MAMAERRGLFHGKRLTMDTHLLLEFAKEGVLLGPQLFDLFASLAASVLQPLVAICSRGAVSVLGLPRSCGGSAAVAVVVAALGLTFARLGDDLRRLFLSVQQRSNPLCCSRRCRSSAGTSASR